MFLFLTLMLQLTVTETGQFTFLTVSDGGHVALPCKNAKALKRTCDSTFWLFSGSARTETVPLVVSGETDRTQISKSKSDRLSVAKNCSLLIEKVAVEDVGMYGCRQIRSGQQDGDDVYVHLSVVTMSQCTDGDAVTLNCSLSTYGHCRHTVKWLYDGKNVDEDNRLTTSQADCSVAVTWLELRSNDTRWDSGFQCEVTDDSTGAVRRFPFTPQPSGEETAKSSTPAEDTTSTGWLRLVIVSAGLITLVVVVVTVDIWSRTKGNKTLMDKNTVDIDEDEDEGSVEYENDGDPSASVRFH